METINEFWLQGRIAALDPIRNGANAAFCKALLRTNTRPDKTGALVEEWHRLLFFRQTAEKFYNNATIGKEVRVKGYLHTHEFVCDGKPGRELQLICIWFSFNLKEKSDK